MSSTAAKQTRNQLSASQKKSIRELQRNNPSWTQERLCQEVLGQLGLAVARPTLSKILKDSGRWLGTTEAEGAGKKQRKACFEKLEQGLFKWFQQARAQNALMSDALLLMKAKLLAEGLGETDFKASAGWLSNFKTRHGIRRMTAHGESGAADQQGMDVARKAVPKIIEAGKSEKVNVFNFDESELCFKSLPSHSLDTGTIRGEKEHKTRIAIGLCVNATGTERLKPVIINRFEKPRCFGKNWTPANVHYFYNESAWMTGAVFTECINRVNREMAAACRNILLMMDNASSHTLTEEATEQEGLRVIQLSNLMLLFMPANTTSAVQPLDAGIIRTFKAHCKRELMRWIFSKVDNRPNEDLSKVLPAVRQAIAWSAQVWQDTDPQTIRNCWRHVNILSLTWCADIANSDERERARLSTVTTELTELMERLGVSDACSVETYITPRMEDQVEAVLTDQEILEELLDPDSKVKEVDLMEVEEEHEPEPCKLSLPEATDILKSFADFISQEPATFSAKDELNVQRLANKLARMHVVRSGSLKQRQISQYFQPAV